MSAKSAMAAVACARTLAGGVFAPGHLGELSQVIPFELVDAVLAERGCRDRRLRALPVRVGVYFVLALCLFPEVGYPQVWEKLVTGLDGVPVVRPSVKALCDLRRRVGGAPLEALFGILAGPVAWPKTPGTCFGGYRLVSFDGCSSQKAPDTARNRAWLGKQREGDGYPMLMLMTLVETGTRALLGAVFGPRDTGEIQYASRLLHLLRPDMLVLWDKGFDGDEFIAAVHATDAKLLGRLRGNRRPPILARLSDGSHLSHLGGVPVRTLEASITVTCQDGTRFTGHYRLVTTLTDHRSHPAGALIALYHQRWEHESAYYALRHTMMHGRVLRSGDPAGLRQELWALLTVYQALRIAMLDAVQTRPGTDPDRACFTTAYQGARDQLIKADTGPEPAGGITARIPATLLPPRRPRVSARKVKSPHSRYHALKPDGRPPTSQNITALDIAVHEPPTPEPPGPLPPVAPVRVGTRRTTQAGRINRVLALLRHRPEHAYSAQEIAEHLHETNLNSLRVQLSKYAQNGIIRKTAPATYTLTATP